MSSPLRSSLEQLPARSASCVQRQKQRQYCAMSGGMATGNARVRIKGRRGSVVRFLIISVGWLVGLF